MVFGLGRKRRLDWAATQLGAQVGDGNTPLPFGTLTSPVTGAIMTPAEWFALDHRGCQVLAFGHEELPGPYSSKGWRSLVQVRTPWLAETRVLPNSPQVIKVYEQMLKPDLTMFVPEHAPNFAVYSADPGQARPVLTADLLNAIDHERRPRPKIIPPVAFVDGVLGHQGNGRLDPEKALGVADVLIDMLHLVPSAAWPGDPSGWPPGPWSSMPR